MALPTEQIDQNVGFSLSKLSDHFVAKVQVLRRPTEPESPGVCVRSRVVIGLQRLLSFMFRQPSGELIWVFPVNTIKAKTYTT